MVTRRDRPLSESHSFYGPLSSGRYEIDLPNWLNAAKGTGSFKRVTKIMDLVRKTDELTTIARKGGAYSGSRTGESSAEKSRMVRAAQASHTELERALRPYQFHVRLTLAIFGGWRANLHCSRRGRDDFGSIAPEGHRLFEGDAVLAICRLADYRVVDRIRRCAMCSENWFFARHSNYRFCSDSCREKYYTSTKEYRDKKARQMREYRARLQKRENG